MSRGFLYGAFRIDRKKILLSLFQRFEQYLKIVFLIFASGKMGSAFWIQRNLKRNFKKEEEVEKKGIEGKKEKKRKQRKDNGKEGRQEGERGKNE